MGRTAPPNKPMPKAQLVEDVEDGSQPLSNPRHEMFAQFRALTAASVGDAYRQAGGPSTGKNATKQGDKIAGRPEVKLRITALQKEQARKLQSENVMTQREILLELKTNVDLGRVVKGGLSASNRALELIGGQEHDMFVVRKENRNRKIDPLDGMDPQALVDFIGKAAARIPGLEIDAEALAIACGFERSEIESGGITGDSETGT